MASIKDFSLLDVKEKLYKSRFVVTHESFYMNKALLEDLGMANYALLYIDVKGKRVAFVPSNQSNSNSIKICNPKNKTNISAKFKNSRVLAILHKMIPNYDKTKRYQFAPNKLDDSNGFYFELSNVSETKSRAFRA